MKRRISIKWIIALAIFSWLGWLFISNAWTIRNYSIWKACVAGNMYVAVSDTAANSLPVLRRPGQGTHAGRGLRIVSASSTWWGVTAAATMKVVWAELAQRAE